jgi:O-methyltransferase
MSKGSFERSIERMMVAWSDFFWESFAALRVNGISGDYVEFGSASGTSMWLADQHIKEHGVPRHLWAFDSFEGLPPASDPLDEHPAFLPSASGSVLDGFHATLAAHGVGADDYTTVVGYYEDTLPALGHDRGPTDIALAYIDCNMYSSTVTVLEFLAPRLKHGMILGFDDWYCWTENNPSGERVATEEFLAAHPEWRFVRFKDVFWGGLAFVVERADSSPPPPVNLLT